MLLESYDTQKLISAFITIIVIGIIIKIYLKWNGSKRINIQKPDWAKKREED